MKLFSWGTYQDYKGLIALEMADYIDNEANLPPLNPAQIDKLRRLTLVTLASESHVRYHVFVSNDRTCNTQLL